MKFFVCATLLISSVSLANELPLPAISASQAQNTLLTDITKTTNQFVAVGKHGTVITSSNALDWKQAEHVPTQALLTAVDFSDADNGWACGHDATIIHTGDGGDSWELQQFLPALDKPCLDILFTTNSMGFAVGAYGMFYQTLDGGKQWQPRFLSSLLYPEDQAYLDDLKINDPEGYAIETASILPHFNRIEKTPTGLMIVGEMGVMAHSNDNGQSWQRLDEIYPGSFFALNENNTQRVVAGLRGNIFTQSSAGGQWEHIKNTKTATINSIISYNNSWLLLANSGVIYTLSENQLTYQQNADAKSILSAVVDKNKLIMTTENGIKVKELTP
ncbi:hypothetical protein J8L70_04315 [Pseudoalteromonas sp. MMG010]|uniref:WD40/YVTN/BNR-like repeat-containing protein n=1 Tax=Pseudoalteromonas sp. MMG010 TaxID=2822685 RepID=UPI001B3A57BF|nr:YCF48-related protein [Pseudoalteromonas sp. MMG010]MBQ4832460.1 hypothetical protein [Pseudoalteromonas sp. MMG010]